MYPRTPSGMADVLIYVKMQTVVIISPRKLRSIVLVVGCVGLLLNVLK